MSKLVKVVERAFEKDSSFSTVWSTTTQMTFIGFVISASVAASLKKKGANKVLTALALSTVGVATSLASFVATSYADDVLNGESEEKDELE